MKKKSLLFLLYCVVIIASLGLCLVFSLNKEKSSDTSGSNQPMAESTVDPIEENPTQEPIEENPTQETIEEQPTEGTTNTPSESIETTSPKETKQSKTKFTLLSENAIYMHIGIELEILDNFFVVENGDVANVETKVLSHYNSDVSGLTYNNRKLTASKIDSYKLEFSLATDENSVIKRDVVVYVEENSKINQNLNELKVNDEYEISSLFEINSSITNYSVEVDETISFRDGKITPNKAGNSKVTISYEVDGIKFIYKFNFFVEDKPLYSIKINNEDLNVLQANLEDEYFMFIYEMFDLDGQISVDQTIILAIADESIVSVDLISAPIVSLKVNGAGSTFITITKPDDPNFIKTIEIKVK